MCGKGVASDAGATGAPGDRGGSGGAGEAGVGAVGRGKRSIGSGGAGGAGVRADRGLVEARLVRLAVARDAGVARAAGDPVAERDSGGRVLGLLLARRAC